MKSDQEYKFFIICPLGLEKLALKELDEKIKLFNLNSIKIIEQNTGGIEIQAMQSEGMALNKILKIPVRILLRIDEFKARDLPKLYNKARSIKWNNYIYNNNLEIKSSAGKSRLIHSDNIKDTLQDAINDYFKEIDVKEKFKKKPYSLIKHKIYINFFNDNATISIDTSGEPLYKRGDIIEKDKFTLRENLAAGCIYQILSKIKPNSTIHDPMCGSGTLIAEFNNFYQISKREFSFELFTKPALKKISPIESSTFILSGSDINSKLFGSAIKLGLNLIIKDVFQINETYDYIFTHPPYGKNIKLEKGNNNKLFEKLRSLSKNVYFIIDIENFKLLQKNLKLKKVLEFNNQGTKTVLGKIDN